MSTIVRDYIGMPLTHQVIVAGNTATSAGKEFYVYTERKLAFTSGGTTEIIAGMWIVGATSAAKAEVVSVTLTSGTWAGGNAAGTFIIKNQHGTFQSENIKVGAGTDDATIAANSSLRDSEGYEYKGMQAKAALVTVITQTVLVLWDGGIPDQTSLVGHSLIAGSSLLLGSENAIRNLKIISRVAGNTPTVNITYYF